YQGVRAAIPQAVERVERSERFGDVARDAKLSQRAREFVDAIPERLRGGEPAEAVRAAATRGVAFVITAILSIFFLLHGPKLLGGTLRQLPDHLQERVRRTLGRAGARASRYALLTLAQAVVAGVVGYAIARGLAVPGAAALGLWLGLWAVVPLVGSFVGALPIVVIAAAQNPWHGVAAGLFFVAYQIADDILVQPAIHRRSMRLGPFLTTLAGAAGLELYGLGGALVTTLAVALVVAALAEVAAVRELSDLPEAPSTPAPVPSSPVPAAPPASAEPPVGPEPPSPGTHSASEASASEEAPG
ncbi:MAG TPA: AI-2E family transporter, partial [Acidimicrobiales bacterium]|nr:AI-2E family transporter [Acidimicrobiales bacterium]